MGKTAKTTARVKAPAHPPQPAKNWQFPLAVLLLLPAALLSANYTKFPVESYQIFSWYLSYECGYISRGLIGSVIKLFYGGSPEMEDTIKIIDTLSSLLLFALIFITWALLALPLLRVKRDAQTRWLLLAFALLLLVSPIWKLASYMKGHMDLWVFTCTMIALIALLRRWAVVFALTLIIGMMVHRLMLPYAALLILLLLHTLFIRRSNDTSGYNDDSSDTSNNDSGYDKRRWGIAAGAAFAVMFLLQLLSDPKNDACALLASNYIDKENMASQFDLIRSAKSMFLHNLSKWVIFPATFWVGLLYFGVPPLLFSIFFVFCCRLRAIDFAYQTLPRPLQFARNASFLLLPLAGASITLPLHLVVSDWSRIYYWSWFGLLLVAIYYYWHATEQTRSPARQSGGAKKARQPKSATPFNPTTAAAAVIITVALTFSATPLIWSNIVYPQLIRFECGRFCFFPLTQNPLGTLWGSKVYYDLAASAIPFHAKGSQLQRMEVPGMHEFETDGDSIIIPTGFEDRPLILDFTVPAASMFRYRVNYDAVEEQPFHLTINQGPVTPTSVRRGSMEWSYPISRDKSRRIIFRLYPRSSDNITLKEVSFELTDDGSAIRQQQ